MTKQQARDHVRAQTESYLLGRGIQLDKPFLCLNPQHQDHHPSMHFDRRRNKVHCFACGADYDIFNLIGIEYGLTEMRDIFFKAYELYHLEVEGMDGAEGSHGTVQRAAAATTRRAAKSALGGSAVGETVLQQTSSRTDAVLPSGNTARTPLGNAAIPPSRSAAMPPPSSGKAAMPLPLPPQRDYGAYYAACRERLGQSDYVARRGISAAVAERFGLGFDPSYPAAGGPWQALIIPTAAGSYIARNTDDAADKKNRYRKQGASLVFNPQALAQAKKPVFVVEGEIDALSILTLGGEAVALGSVANSHSFLGLVRAQKPTQPLLLALDNDESGQQATDAIAAELITMGVAFYRVNLYGEHKDANEALLVDREAFEVAIAAAEGIEEQLREVQRQDYLATSAGRHLSDFLSGIARSVDTPVIPTEFSRLDGVLDGGLYEGLYVVGAISSLGKTTLVCQIADQIAQQGGDVLIFSLEMARAELMAKSISRLTLLDCLSHKRSVFKAKTARGITSGKRYPTYDMEEQAVIHHAMETYGRFAEHIYIHEGVGDIGVPQIRHAVEQHRLFTGKPPVVVIDYLQILAPYSERFSDKQNTDKAVLELKRISRDFKIPVIGISSFNRQNYKEAVTMEAFKESGAIEYSSDVLIGLQLKGAGASGFDATVEKKRNPRQVELVVLKNRNGASGDKVDFDYYPKYNYFKES